MVVSYRTVEPFDPPTQNTIYSYTFTDMQYAVYITMNKSLSLATQEKFDIIAIATLYNFKILIEEHLT